MRNTSGTDRPSTPMWNVTPSAGIHCAMLSNCVPLGNCPPDALYANHSQTDIASGTRLIAIAAALIAAGFSFGMNIIAAAPRSGKNVRIGRIYAEPMLPPDYCPLHTSRPAPPG